MALLRRWESDARVEKRETVIMREMSRSNTRGGVLRNGKPQRFRDEALLIPLSILGEAVSHGRKWREGEQRFFWSLSACGTISLLYGWCLLVILEEEAVKELRRSTCANRVMTEGCGASQHLRKTSWDPDFWIGQALILCHPINQIKEWNPTVLGWKKKQGESLDFYVFYHKLLTS